MNKLVLYGVLASHSEQFSWDVNYQKCVLRGSKHYGRIAGLELDPNFSSSFVTLCKTHFPYLIINEDVELV